MRQTAVEWLSSQLFGAKRINIGEAIEQAKEMEKEQIIDAIIISEKEHIIQGNVYPPQFVVDKAKNTTMKSLQIKTRLQG